MAIQAVLATSAASSSGSTRIGSVTAGLPRHTAAIVRIATVWGWKHERFRERTAS